MKLKPFLVFLAAVSISGCHFQEINTLQAEASLAKIFDKAMIAPISLSKAEDVTMKVQATNIKLDLVLNSYHNAKINLTGVMSIDKPPYEIITEFNAIVNARIYINQSSGRVLIGETNLQKITIPKMHEAIRGEVLVSAPGSLSSMLKSNIDGKSMFDFNNEINEFKNNKRGNEAYDAYLDIYDQAGERYMAIDFNKKTN